MISEIREHPPWRVAADAFRIGLGSHRFGFLAVFVGCLMIGEMIYIAGTPTYEVRMTIAIGRIFKDDALTPIAYGETLRSQIQERIDRMRAEAGITDYSVQRVRHLGRFFVGVRVRGQSEHSLVRYLELLRDEIGEVHGSMLSAGELELQRRMAEVRARRAATPATRRWILDEKLDELVDFGRNQKATRISIRPMQSPRRSRDEILSLTAMSGFVLATLVATVAGGRRLRRRGSEHG